MYWINVKIAFEIFDVNHLNVYFVLTSKIEKSSDPSSKANVYTRI